MKPKAFTIAASLVLLFGSAAGASTLVDLVCGAEVLHAGEYDEESGTLELVVRIDGVDMEASATDYFADSFMEYEGASKRKLRLSGISPESAGLIIDGSKIDLHFHSVSCICMGEDGAPEAYSSTTWTFLGMSEGLQDLPSNALIALL